MMNNWLLRCVITAALFVLALAALGTTYYVSPDGNDANAGMSQDASWKSVAKVNALALKPGDVVAFAGGEFFHGTLELDAADSGLEGNPVTITSYGAGRATIVSGAANGLHAANGSSVKIANLNLLGAGRNTGNNRGIDFDTMSNSEIDNVEVRGYQRAGIDLRNSVKVRVTHVFATENGFVGIHCSGKSSDIYLGYCQAINNPGYQGSRNHSGNGILFESGPKNCLVEYCEAAFNGWDMGNPTGTNGPVGMWTWDSDNITFQYCIAHDNKSTKGDGGGFDFDGGTRNSTFQYCYSYNNWGSGFLVMPYTKTNKVANCTIRYCISENDGLDPHPGNHHASLFLILGDNDLRGVYVYNNIFYNQDDRDIVSIMGDPSVSTNYFYNNVFLLKGNGQFIANKFAGKQPFGITFTNNCYWSYDGKGDWFGFKSLQEFREKTGQEMLNGKPVGLFTDPQFLKAGVGEKITDPTKLPSLMAYLFKEGSPCLKAGLDLQKTFGIDPGKRDFFGNPLPTNALPSIGAGEVPAKPEPVKATP